MTNTINKNRVFTIILSFLGLMILLNSCYDKNDIKPSCGCESETKTTIPESANLTGKLFFKNDSRGNNYYNRKYWIVIIPNDCGNCVHNLIVCNDSFLNTITNIPILTNVHDIIASPNELDGAIDVKISGYIKPICNPIFAPADYTYENIILTSIKQL
jgi:hypothetical protein